MLYRYAFYSIFTLVCTIYEMQAQPSIVWEQTYPGGIYIEEAHTIQPTADGGFLLAIANGGYEIVKIDANANKEWSQVYNGAPWVIEEAADGNFFLGGSAITKIDPSGNVIWEIPYGARAIEATPDGGFVVGGDSETDKSDSNPDCQGNCALDYWVAKFDAGGNIVWEKIFGGSAEDDLVDVTATTDGGFLVGGTSWSDAGFDKSEDSRGDDTYEWDFWVLKIDGDGNKIWDKTYGGIAFDGLQVIQPTDDGNFLLAGYSWSPIGFEKSQDIREDPDYWLIKIDPDGNKLWDKTYGGNYIDELFGLQPTSDGGYLLGGWSESNAGFEKSENAKGYWIIKVDQFGNKLWDKVYSPGGELYALQATNDGGFLLGGEGNGGYHLIKITEPTASVAQPRDVIATEKDDCSRVIFSWTSIPGAKRYNYRIQPVGQNLWRNTNTLSGKDIVYEQGGRTYVDLQYPLASQTEYYFEVQTVLPGNARSVRTQMSFITNGSTQTPTNLMEEAISSETAELSWLPDDCSQYYSYRLRAVGTNKWRFSSTKKVDAGHEVLSPEKVRVLDLTPNTTYEWKVQTVYTHKQKSKWSQLATFSTASEDLAHAAFSEQRISNIDKKPNVNAAPDPPLHPTFSYNLYPNPVQTQLFVAVKSPVSEEVNIAIYDIVGRLLYQQRAHLTTGYNEVEISLADLNANATQLLLRLQSPSYGIRQQRLLRY